MTWVGNINISGLDSLDLDHLLDQLPLPSTYDYYGESEEGRSKRASAMYGNRDNSSTVGTMPLKGKGLERNLTVVHQKEKGKDEFVMLPRRASTNDSKILRKNNSNTQNDITTPITNSLSKTSLNNNSTPNLGQSSVVGITSNGNNSCPNMLDNNNNNQPNNFSHIINQMEDLCDPSKSKSRLSQTDVEGLATSLSSLPFNDLEELHSTWHNFKSPQIKRKSNARNPATKNVHPVIITDHTLLFGVNDPTDPKSPKLFPLRTVLKEQIQLTNIVKYGVNYQFFTYPCNDWSITIEPKSGFLAPEKSTRRATLFMSQKKGRKDKDTSSGSEAGKVTITMKINRQCKVNTFIRLAFDRDHQDHFFIINGDTENSSFGLALDNPLVDFATDMGHRVPSVLYQLRQALVSTPNWQHQGIFLIPGDDYDVDYVLRQIAQTQDPSSLKLDALAISSAVKLFFRQIPISVLQQIPRKKILFVTDNANIQAEIIYDIFNSYVSDPLARSAALWLFDLILMCTNEAHRVGNSQITMPKLAICLAPNLYRVTEGSTKDIGLLKQMSDAIIDFVTKCIEARQNQMLNG